LNRFQRDTTVHRTGPGLYSARIDPGWWIRRAPNGGYVAAIILRAMTDTVDDASRRPRSLTVHFIAPPGEGDVRIEARRERTGRSLTSVTARLEHAGTLCALATAAFSKDRDGPSFDHMTMPEVAPPEQCELLPSPPAGIALRDRFESRPTLAAASGRRTAEARSGGWIRLREDPGPIDPPLLAAYSDAWPPALFQRVPPEELRVGVPTVDLTVHFRSTYALDADPADFVLAVFRSRLAAGGFVEEDGEIWSRKGTLLLQSRQLALVG
jgi:acyl-CoA thioesterase